MAVCRDAISAQPSLFPVTRLLATKRSSAINRVPLVDSESIIPPRKSVASLPGCHFRGSKTPRATTHVVFVLIQIQICVPRVWSYRSSVLYVCVCF